MLYKPFSINAISINNCPLVSDVNVLSHSFFSDVIVLRVCLLAGGNHATTVAVVTAKEIAEGNRVACNKRKIEIQLVRQLQRQAPLRSGSAVPRATADRSSSNCSFSFSTAGSTVSYTARGSSHHGRTSITQVPKSTVRSSSLSGNKRERPARPNSKGVREGNDKIHCKVDRAHSWRPREIPDQTR